MYKYVFACMPLYAYICFIMIYVLKWLIQVLSIYILIQIAEHLPFLFFEQSLPQSIWNLQIENYFVLQETCTSVLHEQDHYFEVTAPAIYCCLLEKRQIYCKLGNIMWQDNITNQLIPKMT